jgi:hypothetical protein
MTMNGVALATGDSRFQGADSLTAGFGGHFGFIDFGVIFMIEFLLETIQPPNLPATVLLGVVLLYWSLMIVGIFGFDGLDADVGLEADADLDADIDGHVDGGIASDVLTFFHLGEVPVMIIATFFVLFFWIATMVTNHYWNPDQDLLVALRYLIPNVVVGLVLTKLCVWPFTPLFREMRKTDAPKVVGSRGVVCTSYLDGAFGQIRIQQDGPPIVVNAVTSNGQRLVRDVPVQVIRFDRETGVYIVEAVKPEKK